jgi:4-hydroxysphinganine ceramide fatty acyl 2-hydroxylase
MSPGKTLLSRTAHFLIHGIHHKTPFDDTKIVFPIFPASIILIFVHYLVRMIFFANCFNPRIITCGLITGYIAYDFTHSQIHNESPLIEYFYFLKRYHFRHHFSDQDIGYGVTSPFWDKIFNTEINIKKLSFRLKWSSD